MVHSLGKTYVMARATHVQEGIHMQHQEFCQSDPPHSAKMQSPNIG